jgi:threonine aldolase
VDFSKGLGAPVGAVLASSRELIDEAWRYKQMMGGALRQAGIVAAGCLYALDHNVDRLADDHANARRLAEGLGKMGLDVEPVETNIVICRADDAAGLTARLAERGVEVSAATGGRIRMLTHLDVDEAGIDRALGAFEEALT